jgi:hypothetical protein
MNTDFLLAYPLSIPSQIKEEVNKLHPNNHLFGSRWMAQYWPDHKDKVTTETDWDFAFPYEGSEWGEVEKAKSTGWEQKQELKYRDNLHFITWEKQIGDHKVQMCSKINLDIFVGVFRSIDPPFYWRFLHKTSSEVLEKEVQKELFNQLYRTWGY